MFCIRTDHIVETTEINTNLGAGSCSLVECTMSTGRDLVNCAILVKRDLPQESNRTIGLSCEARQKEK